MIDAGEGRRGARRFFAGGLAGPPSLPRQPYPANPNHPTETVAASIALK